MLSNDIWTIWYRFVNYLLLNCKWIVSELSGTVERALTDLSVMIQWQVRDERCLSESPVNFEWCLTECWVNVEWLLSGACVICWESVEWCLSDCWLICQRSSWWFKVFYSTFVKWCLIERSMMFKWFLQCSLYEVCTWLWRLGWVGIATKSKKTNPISAARNRE